MAQARFDVAVIGGGPGGYVAGIRLGQLGKKVVVLEREHLGGVCLNWGCIPSKAIIHTANLRGEAKEFNDSGVFLGRLEVDAKALMAWKDALILRQRGGIASLLKANGCEHRKGEATLTTSNALVLRSGDGSEDELHFDHLILATGAGTIEIPGFPYDGQFVGYARHAVAYDPLPRDLVIIGGGVIGSELGMAYAKLGSTVTIVEMLDTILPGTDKDLLRPVERRMKKIGIEVLTGAKAKSAKKSGPGAGEVEVEVDGKTRSIRADRVLVAVGFKPQTGTLGLDAAGVKADAKGWIPVDVECRTNVRNIFAVGDVTGPPLLAHRASRMGEVAAEVIAGHRAAFDVMAMPLGVFTDPEIAIVGLTEAQARERGLDVSVGLFPTAALGRAGAMNQTDGVIKLVMNPTTDVILGVGIAAPNANDLIAECCLAIEMGALAEDVALTVHVHPTLSEGVMEAAKAARGEAVHIINKRRTTPSRGNSVRPT